ncbi:MAG: YCF48-related protein [Acidobacteriota bacterium]
MMKQLNSLGYTSYSVLVLLVVMSNIACKSIAWRILMESNTLHAPTFVSICFINNNHGWAASTSQILETTDGGQHWSEQQIGNNATFYTMKFIDNSNGWILGAYQKNDNYSPIIFKTMNAGRSWQPIPITNVNKLVDFAFYNSDLGWAVGANSIVCTKDGGNTWEIQYQGVTGETILSVSCSDSEHIWAVGSNELILTTEDGGKNWKRIDIDLTDALLRVHYFNNSVWILGLNGVVAQLNISNKKWQFHSLDFKKALTDVYFKNNQGWIVGEEGAIFYSTDQGNTWKKQPSLTNSNLLCLFFVDSQHGWAGGERNTLLHYSN